MTRADVVAGIGVALGAALLAVLYARLNAATCVPTQRCEKCVEKMNAQAKRRAAADDKARTQTPEKSKKGKSDGRRRKEVE
eukprot:1141360-Prymnesium_polylepis.1